jgi:uncharacterized protein (TIGR00661 family)
MICFACAFNSEIWKLQTAIKPMGQNQRSSAHQQVQTILICPFDLMSHYLRCIELAKSMKNKFKIYFLGSESFNFYVSSAGFEIVEMPEKAYSNVVEKAKDFDFSWINRKDVRVSVNHLIHVFNKYQPDLVIYDTFFGAKAACEYCNIPSVSVLNAYVSKYYDDIRPLPDHHKAVKYKSKLNDKSWKFILTLAEKIQMHFVHRSFRMIRKELHLKRYSSILDELEGDFNIICDDTELFPLKTNLPENYYMCGPVIFNSAANNEDLKKLLSESTDRKTIFVSLGSSGNSNNFRFFEHDFFRKFNIIFSGYSSDFNSENKYYRRFVNFKSIRQFVDLTVCHGGNGTIYQSLAAGIPVLSVPFIFEQGWNAYRVDKMKLGLSHNPKNGIDDFIERTETLLSLGSTETHVRISKRISANPFSHKFYYAIEDIVRKVQTN